MTEQAPVTDNPAVAAAIAEAFKAQRDLIPAADVVAAARQVAESRKRK